MGGTAERDELLLGWRGTVPRHVAGGSRPNRYRAVRGALAMALIGAICVVAGIVPVAAPWSSVDAAKAAGSALDCTLLFATNNSGALQSIDTSTGTVSSIGAFPSTSVNALGITVDGTNLYAVKGGTVTAGQTPSIYRYDVASSTFTTYSTVPLVNSLTSTTVLRGGMNPVNGIFYYSSPRTNTAIQDFYAFDSNTNTAIGYIGSMVGFTGQSGDLGFDGVGNMYVVVSSGGVGTQNLVRISNIPTTPGTAALAGTLLTTLPTGALFGGIAFGVDGYLYVSANGNLLKLNPDTGAQVSSVALSQVGINDLAGCNPSGSLQLQKFIAGRSSPSDQFTLAITGGGLSGGNTATTTGSTTGLQTASAAIAGPVIAVPNTVLTLTETAVSGSLTTYQQSVSCVDATNTNAAVPTVAAGVGVWSLSVPPQTGARLLANIICTITNTPMMNTVKVITSVNGAPATASTFVKGGDTVAYTITTSNPATTSGSTTLSDTVPTNTVYSGSGEGWSCASGSPAGTQCDQLVDVAPGSSTSTTYTVTVANPIPAGTTSITNVATSTSGSCSCTASNPTAAQTNAVKVAGVVSGPNASGEFTATYSINVTNSGSAATTYDLVDTPSFSDGLTVRAASWSASGPGAPLGSSAIGTGPYTLAPSGTPLEGLSSHAYNVTVTFTFDHNVSVSPCDGSPGSGLFNSVNMGGETASTSDNSACIDPPLPPHPSMTLTKASSTTSYAAVNDVIAYTFDVANTGNVTLSNVTVNDAMTAPATVLTTGPTCPQTTLSPGASMECVAAYAVTQADLDNGTVHNSATASASDPGNNPIPDTPPSAVTVPASAAHGLTLTKNSTTKLVTAAGQIVSYTFAVKNTGNQTLTNLTVTDAFTAHPNPGLTVTCPVTTLAASGGSTVCTATYTVTQADVDAPSKVLENTATAHATSPDGSVDSITTTLDIPTAQAPALAIVKSADKGSVSSVGEVIEYTFVVTNTGNVSLGTITVADTMTAPAVELDAPVSCPSTTLAPGVSMTCTASYSVKQVDLDVGRVINSAIATGQRPCPSPILIACSSVTSEPSAVTVDGVQQIPAILPSTGSATRPTVDLAEWILVLGSLAIVASRRRKSRDA